MRKPAGGVRGIASSDTFRRLVSRCLARQYADTFDQATRPYQFALQTRAGTDALSGKLRAAIDLDADATIVSLDGRSMPQRLRHHLSRPHSCASCARSPQPWCRSSGCGRARSPRTTGGMPPAPGGASVRAKAASRATPWHQPGTRLANMTPSLLPTSACNLVNAWPPSSTTSTL